MPQKTVMSIPLPHKNAQVYEGIEAGLSQFVDATVCQR